MRNRPTLFLDLRDAALAIPADVDERIAIFIAWIVWVANVIAAPLIFWPGIVADELEHPSVALSALDRWQPRLAELVLWCNFPFL